MDIQEDYKTWYIEAIEMSNEYGFAGMSASGVIDYLGEENYKLHEAIRELSNRLSKYETSHQA